MAKILPWWVKVIESTLHPRTISYGCQNVQCDRLNETKNNIALKDKHVLGM